MDNLSPGPDNGCPGGVQFGPFRSLRSRMMMPLISIALLAAILVAIASYWLAHRAVMVQVEQRFAAIHRAIQQTNFPLTKGVLSTLGELTAAHWITMSVDGRVIDATPGSEQDANLETAVQRWAGRAMAERAVAGDKADDANPQSQQIDSLYEQFLAAAEPALLQTVLDATQGNRAAAAQRLGLHRTTLRERLKRYGL